MTEFICIVCPKGCHLRIDEGSCAVTGNACSRGETYAQAELTNPTRVITSTVRAQGGIHRRCPVKTDHAIPKRMIFEAMELLDTVELTAPVQSGAIVVKNIFDTGANFVTTADL